MNTSPKRTENITKEPLEQSGGFLYNKGMKSSLRAQLIAIVTANINPLNRLKLIDEMEECLKAGGWHETEDVSEQNTDREIHV